MKQIDIETASFVDLQTALRELSAVAEKMVEPSLQAIAEVRELEAIDIQSGEETGVIAATASVRLGLAKATDDLQAVLKKLGVE